MISYEHNNPQTSGEIVQFLWDKLKASGWPWKPDYCGRCSPACLRGYYCESCEVEQGEEHKPGCDAKATMLRIEAFIRVEAELEEKRREAEWSRMMRRLRLWWELFKLGLPC